MRKRTLIIFLALWFISSPSLAHKVNLFCYIKGTILYGKSYFSGGRSAQKAKVEVYNDTDNSLMATILTDEQGKFSLPLENVIPLRVVLYAGQGHKTEFRVKPDRGEVPKMTTTTTEQKTQIDDIESMIDSKLESLQERILMLEKKFSKSSFVTIAGGIGWIFGIFALLYFWKKKNAS